MTTDHLDDEAISAHLDGEATPEEASHVDACATCTARLAELRAAAAAIGSPVAVDAAAREAAIAAALDAMAAPGGRVDHGDNVVPFRRRGLPQWLSVAAALLVVVALVPLLGSIGDGASDDADEAATSAEVADDAAGGGESDTFAMGLAPVEGGDVGEVDESTVRQLVTDAVRESEQSLRAAPTADGGEDAAEMEADEGSADAPVADAPVADSGAAGTTASQAAPLPCEDQALADFPDLGALRYRALGTVDGEAQSILAYELPDDGRLRVLVYAVETCTITIVQELEPS